MTSNEPTPNYYITRDDLIEWLIVVVREVRRGAYDDACQAVLPAAVKASAEIAMRVSGEVTPTLATSAIEGMVRAAVDEVVRSQPITVNVTPIVEAVMPPRKTTTQVDRDRRGLITKTTATETDA